MPALQARPQPALRRRSPRAAGCSWETSQIPSADGYQDSRYVYVLDVAGIVPRQRQPNVGMVLIDSQMVGGMRRTIRPGRVHFAVSALRDLDPSEEAAVHEAARRYGRFLDLDAQVGLARA